MSEEKEISPAVQMYQLAMRFEGFQQCKSNLRFMHCRHQIIEYCIKFGIKFFEDDFKSRIPCPGEGWYALACGEKREFENRSAVLAMEKYWNRKPFLLREIRNKTPERVYVGRWFEWLVDGQKLQLLCTSFNDEKKYFNACQYGNNRCRNDNPVKRFKITHEDIKNFHKILDEINKKSEAKNGNN